MKTLIFDFDYTLGDSTKGIVISINYALNQLGYDTKSISEIKKTIGLSLKETYFSLTANHNMNNANQFAELFKIKADEVMVENTILYPNVEKVLQNLKTSGCKTAIVTTKFHYRIEQILSKFDANNLINIIVGAEDVRVEKPDPEGLLLAIKHLKAEKKDVLYIGDSFIDEKTAEHASVKFAAVLTGTTTKADFKNYNCEYIGENIVDIYEYILSSDNQLFRTLPMKGRDSCLLKQKD